MSVKPFSLFVFCLLLFNSCSNSGQEQADAATETAASEEPQMAASPPPAPSFSKNLSLQGISFAVTAENGMLTVQPSGLEVSNEKWETEIDGKLMDAEVEDLDSDGSPELLVYVQSGEMRIGKVIGYSVNNKKSMSMINMPDINTDEKAGFGYMGDDKFSVMETKLARRFPIFNGDMKTDKIRDVIYSLRPGEAMKTFVVTDMNEYTSPGN